MSIMVEKTRPKKKIKVEYTLLISAHLLSSDILLLLSLPALLLLLLVVE